MPCQIYREFPRGSRIGKSSPVPLGCPSDRYYLGTTVNKALSLLRPTFATCVSLCFRSFAMNWESKYVQDFQKEVEKNGLRNPDSIAKFFKSKMDGWKEVQVDIAITGDSGAGKSSFINTIRG